MVCRAVDFQVVNSNFWCTSNYFKT